MPIAISNYQWLDTLPLPLPRMLTEARKLLGTKELTGAANNPVIMQWADELGGSVESGYTADSVAWCGLFIAIVARRAGKTPVAAPLWALNWGKFGEPAGQPALGDVLTFMRPLPNGGTAGHVALYVAEDQKAYHVIGGNQSDQVCFTRIAKERLRAVRRPPYMNMPASVRPYVVPETGTLSDSQQ